jgi:hypothetical protein
MELGGQKHQSQRSAVGPQKIVEGNITPQWLEEDVGVTGKGLNGLVPDIRISNLRYRYMSA